MPFGKIRNEIILGGDPEMINGLNETRNGEILKEALLILIDNALDRNDRENFLALTKELQSLTQKIG